MRPSVVEKRRHGEKGIFSDKWLFVAGDVPIFWGKGPLFFTGEAQTAGNGGTRSLAGPESGIKNA